MCGIIGVIGVSKDPERSYELTTHLLRETGIRGKDATGFFSISQDGEPDCFKSPRIPRLFVKMQPWRKRAKTPRVLIGHTRSASISSGSVNNNFNNHPHTNEQKTLALVHNGWISDYHRLRTKFNISPKGRCDSEILLHLIDKARHPIEGIQQIYREVAYGSFSCMVSHQQNDQITIYAFREQGRPLEYVDLREELGQLFFCSTAQIWKKAITKAGMSKQIQKAEINKIPADEIWEINAKTLEIIQTQVLNTSSVSLYNRNNSHFQHLFRNGQRFGAGRKLDTHLQKERELDTHLQKEIGDSIDRMLEKLITLRRKIKYNTMINLTHTKQEINFIEKQIGDLTENPPIDVNLDEENQFYLM